jgi:hypothetical protein
MDGQAESAPETEGLAGLAGFLSDKPEKDPEDNEPLNTDEAPEESDNADEDNDGSDDEPEGDEPEDDDEPAPVASKVTFKVKGEDGNEETVELSPDELPAAFMRQRDYTRKTVALAERENQAVAFLQTKHEEVRNQYMEQAAFARSAVEQMAGFRSDSEMAQLAQNDPAAWVAENQRQQQIKAFLGTLDGNLKREREQAGEQSKAQQQRQYQQTIEASWAELAKEKIDRPALVKIYESTAKHFGFKPEEMGNITDHRVVRMMRDAAAYRELKAKAPEVTRKAQDAPRMPAARQATPAQERQKQALAKPFQGGRAKLNDLAAYLR